MADEDDVVEGGEEGGAPDKKGGGGMIVKLLKFVALGLGALIVIVTVVYITFRIMNGGGKQTAQAIPQSESYIAVKPIYSNYDGIGNITTKSRDPTPYNVVVQPILEYDQGDNSTQTELIARKTQMQDFVRRYFSSKYAQDLAPENELKIKNEIKELLNTTVLDKARVRGVLFTQFDTFTME